MTTTNLGMTVPTVGADTDNWGADLNANLALIDAFAGTLMGAAEVTLASAATTDIGDAASTAVAISGTTAITSFGTKANCIRFVRFTGAVPLSYNATSLVLLGGASRTVVSGARGIYKSDASGNWTEIAYADQDVSSKAAVQFGSVSASGNGSFNYNTTGGSVFTGAGGFNTEGFGVSAQLAVDGSITTTSGNGVKVVCISNGVILNNGTSSWSAISARANKKDLVPIQSPLQTVNNMSAYLGRYKGDDQSVKLRPFLIYEEAEEHFPYITTYRAAHKMEHKHPETGEVLGMRDVPEHKGIMYDAAIPLLFAAIQELSAKVDALAAAKA
jgi:hypothetical protein